MCQSTAASRPITHTDETRKNKVQRTAAACECVGSAERTRVEHTGSNPRRCLSAKPQQQQLQQSHGSRQSPSHKHSTHERTHIRTHQHSLPHRHSNSTQQRCPLQASYRASLPPTSPTQRHRQAASGEALSKRGGKERAGRGCARNKLEKKSKGLTPHMLRSRQETAAREGTVRANAPKGVQNYREHKQEQHTTARKASPPHQHQHQAASRTALPPSQLR